MQAATKVLLIEDLELAQITATRIFKELGCEVEIAESAANALQSLFQDKFDIIFVDLQLPDMSGYELAQTIRSIERKSHTPLIAVTANSHEELSQHTKQVGFEDFLIKPVTLESARYMLSKHLYKISSEKVSGHNFVENS